MIIGVKIDSNVLVICFEDIGFKPLQAIIYVYKSIEILNEFYLLRIISIFVNQYSDECDYTFRGAAWFIQSHKSTYAHEPTHFG